MHKIYIYYGMHVHRWSFNLIIKAPSKYIIRTCMHNLLARILYEVIGYSLSLYEVMKVYVCVMTGLCGGLWVAVGGCVSAGSHVCWISMACLELQRAFIICL